MTDREYHFDFTQDSAQRLDKFLVSCLPAYSRTRIQSFIENGHVSVNGAPPTKAGMLIEAPCRIVVLIPPPEATALTGENIPLDIIFEDQNLLVINKPAGMVVHPSAGHSSGTLVHAALGYAPDIEGVGGQQRPGVVHRLDKDTSGLILMAKNDKSHQWLQNQFRNHKIKKTYLALVDGGPPTPNGRIEAPIGRDMTHRKKMAITTSDKGREAVTEYFTVKKFTRHTFLEAHPLTGRTHQIRVHLAFIHCPITGDTLYGHSSPSIPISRQFLHAAKIQVTLPGEESPRLFETPLPPDLQEALDHLPS